MTRKLPIAAILAVAGLLGAILLVAAWNGARDEPPQGMGNSTTAAPGPAGPSAASSAEPASGDTIEEERQYSLDHPIELPVTPDGRSPLVPRDLRLPAPNPNAADSAAEGTAL